MAELTPMMKQYLEIKKANPGSILFFRLGDFYEMFDEDARVASKELDLTLTTLDKDPVAKGIWEAAWQDCLEGNMSQSWEHHSQRQGYLHVKYIDEDGEWQLVSINIFTEAKNIQHYFKSLNP